MNYRITERIVQTTDGKREIRYITELAPGIEIGNDKLVWELSYATGLSYGQVLDVLSSLESLLIRELPLGNIVRIPHLGSMKLIANAARVPEKVQAGQPAIRKIRLHFLENAALKSVCG